MSATENPTATVVYDLNVLGAFAVQKYWEGVRAKVLTLANGDETVPIAEVVRILDEPVVEILRMFSNALKAVQGGEGA